MECGCSYLTAEIARVCGRNGRDVIGGAEGVRALALNAVEQVQENE